MNEPRQRDEQLNCNLFTNIFYIRLYFRFIHIRLNCPTCQLLFIMNIATLQSEINVGPTFINFGFFSSPHVLIKDPTFIKYQSFFHGLRIFSSFLGVFNTSLHILFQALRLLFFPNFPGPTFIPCPTSILDSRVVVKKCQ